jgi:hypothetical protein
VPFLQIRQVQSISKNCGEHFMEKYRCLFDMC